MISPWAKYAAGAALLVMIIMSLTNFEGLGTWENNLYGASSASEESLSKNGFLPMDKARDYCQTRHWDPYPYRNNRRKIYDLFIINTELDWLEIRMGELQNEVDYFVILEAETTFTEAPKPLHIQENWARFAPFHPKMIHHVLNQTDVEFDGTWARESFSRNAMFDQVIPFLDDEKAAGQGDVILVSDVDEIPRPDTLKALRNCMFPRKLTLRSHFYYYGFQWLHRGEQWPHPQATFFEGPDHTVKPEELRSRKDSDGDLWNAAWHCSYCFGKLQDFVDKIQSFSHTEMNQPRFTDRAKILQRVRHGIDMFERDNEKFDRIDTNNDVPQYLLENRDRFGYTISRDPPNGNFEDFEESDLMDLEDS
ncbi:MAG: hypothetical protein LQ338_006161 [Usnochroma carphineum]|nr:MAG: hypothetical protein LQ338_006161 [Usnochroma carphineum]